jgi:catechol 2,3-dioxygenase-like lactoylglutathione lyase family enzyme
MNVKGMYLSWIVVKDIKEAIEFYTKTLGLKLNNYDENYGWAELSGSEGGAILGIAQQNDFDKMPPGQMLLQR